MKLITQNHQKKWLFSRNTCSWKGSSCEKREVSKVSACFEKVDILSSYLFWRKSSSETVAVLKKYLYSRCSGLEKFILPRSAYKNEVTAPGNWVFCKKSLCKNLSFHSNRCCSGNIAASIISLFHSDWCSEIRWKKVR